MVLLVVVGILPVLLFLGTLMLMDSFKLVRFNFVSIMIVTGGLLAALCYFINTTLLDLTGVSFVYYSRYGSPLVEELLKASVLLLLFRQHKVGFLIDAAICGFAVGAGFAVAENLYYLFVNDVRDAGVWIIRGFGTAIMHGGVTAAFAILSQALIDKHEKVSLAALLPGLLLATVIHSLYNHFFLPPIFSTMVTILLLPVLLYLIFEKSSAALHDWLELDFDADADLIHQINSGEFTETRVGHYLNDLRDRFEGLVIVDMLCYLRIYTELSMRAKGVMLMRQHGLEVPEDPDIEAQFVELRYLEKSIGRTGLLAIEPFLDISRRDLWHLNVLESSHA